MHIHQGAYRYLKKKKKKKRKLPKKKKKKEKIDGSSSSDHLRLRIPPLPAQVLTLSPGFSSGFSSEYRRSRKAKKRV